MDEFRSYFTNKSKKSSLDSMLPIPKIAQIEQRHACVMLPSFLQYAFLFGHQNYDEKFQHLVESDKGREKIHQAWKNFLRTKPKDVPIQTCYVACLLYWFDDWDSSGSMTKSNKHGIFTGVCAVIFVDHNQQIVKTYSNILASGPSKTNHDLVFEKIGYEFDLLQQERWSNCFEGDVEVKQTVYIYPTMFYIICDQPA